MYPEESIQNVFHAMRIDPALRQIFNSEMPTWLTLSQLNHETATSDGKCYTSCLTRGLQWAQTLGDAARNGFKMVYAPIDQHEWFKPSLAYYTTLLHKRLMGETVLETKLMNGNRFDAHVYSHCTRNESGAFTIYGVNTADDRARVLAKMPLMRSGNEYLEYVLTVNSANGKVQLNGNDIIEGMPLTLSPVVKTKRFQKPAILSMPAHSVGFWVFSKARVVECEREHDVDQAKYTKWGKTSSEQLLVQLIREEIERDNEMEKNLIGKTKSMNRERRSIPNEIEKDHKLNAIKKNVNGGDNGIHKRNRRSIDAEMTAARHRRAGNLINLIYNEMDTLKHGQTHSPLKSDAIRSKRHINALSRLLEKFELKKPAFNFKPSTFKLSAAAIPPITAVHDIYSVNSAERKVFDSVENPELPAGDIHFDFEEMANGAANPANGAYVGAENGVARNQEIQEAPVVNEPIQGPEEVIAPGNHEMYYESLFGDAPLPQTPSPPQPFNQPGMTLVNPQQQPRFDELWEMDAAQFPSMPSLAAKQPTQDQDPAINTNIDFVVKELQPTWQMNHENLQKARNQMQKFYPPSISSTKISSLLPNVARPQPIRSPFFDSAEKRFFETRRRRRRSINAHMNDEIEQRVQNMAGKRMEPRDSGEYNNLDDAIGKLSILDRALKIVAEMDRKTDQGSKQQTDLEKITAELKKLGEFVAQSASSLSPPSAAAAAVTPDENTQKRCKILSKSMEQRCLREPALPVLGLFKRENEDKAKKPTGPIKKLLAKVKENQRHKRSISDSLDEIMSNNIHLNEIPRELFGETRPIEVKFVKKPYERKEEKPLLKKVYDSAIEPVPEMLRAVKKTVNKLVDSVTQQVYGFWKMWS